MQYEFNSGNEITIGLIILMVVLVINVERWLSKKYLLAFDAKLNSNKLLGRITYVKGVLTKYFKITLLIATTPSRVLAPMLYNTLVATPLYLIVNCIFGNILLEPYKAKLYSVCTLSKTKQKIKEIVDGERRSL